MPQTEQLKKPQVLLTAVQIHQRADEMAAQIYHDYSPRVSDKEPLTLGVILKGGFVFAADLMRALGPYQLPIKLQTTRISSYGNETESSGQVKFFDEITEGITGAHVLVIDDILDTGQTISALFRKLDQQHPVSLAAAMMLHKVGKLKVPQSEVDRVNYIGFEIPDVFVVGHGLDDKGFCRDWPDVCVKS